jgi:hypothetical protein
MLALDKEARIGRDELKQTQYRPALGTRR